MSEMTSPLSGEVTDQTTVEVIRLSFYAVAGIGGVVALTVAYRRQRLNEGAEEREQEKRFDERFTAASDQLASERAANRLAGVHAMARLADAWHAGRQTCIDVLCSYMKLPYQPPSDTDPSDPSAAPDSQLLREERLVRGTIANVIGMRLRSAPVKHETWHECDFDFTGATIDGGDFRGAVFKGQVSFAHAHFPAGEVSFIHARFENIVRFDNATISGGRLNFIDAKFEHLANFSFLEMTAGSLLFSGAEFNQFTTFAGSTFKGGTVNFAPMPERPATRFGGPGPQFALVAFAGATVLFNGIRLDGAVIDLQTVMDWSVPPSFDAYPDGLPATLRLPAEQAVLLTQPQPGTEA